MPLHPKHPQPMRSADKAGDGPSSEKPAEAVASFAEQSYAAVIDEFLERVDKEIDFLRTIKSKIKHDPQRQEAKRAIDEHIDWARAIRGMAQTAALEHVRNSKASFAMGATLRQKMKVVQDDIKQKSKSDDQAKQILEKMTEFLEKMNKMKDD